MGSKEKDVTVRDQMRIPVDTAGRGRRSPRPIKLPRINA